MAASFFDWSNLLGTDLSKLLGLGNPLNMPPPVPTGTSPTGVVTGPTLGGTPPAAAGGLLGGQGLPVAHKGLLGDFGESVLGHGLAGALAGIGSVQPGTGLLGSLGQGAQGAITAGDARQQEQLKNWYMQQTVQQANQKTQTAQQQKDYLANAAPPPGVDAAQWKNYVQADTEGAMAVLGKTMTPDKPTHSGAYNEYQDAVASGYKGTFTDYQNEDANRKRSISHTTNVTNMPKPPPTLTERVWSTLTDPNADPGSAQYALAYQEATKPIPIQTGTDANGAPTFTYRAPEMPPMIRRPTYMGGGGAPAAGDGTVPPPVTSSEVSGGAPATSSTAASGTAAAPSTTTVGGQTIQTVPTGPAKPKEAKQPTQDQAKNEGLYNEAAKELPTVLQTFNSASSLFNRAAGNIPLIGNFLQSSNYQQFKYAAGTILANWLYSTSGATITPQEAAKQFEMDLPMPGDDTPAIADKRARIIEKVETIRRRAALGLAPGVPEPAGGGTATGGQGGNKKWHYENGELVPDEALR